MAERAVAAFVIGAVVVLFADLAFEAGYVCRELFSGRPMPSGPFSLVPIVLALALGFVAFGLMALITGIEMWRDS